MYQAGVEPGPGSQSLALQDLGIDGREGITGGEHALHALPGRVQQHHDNGITAGPVAQGLGTASHQRGGIGLVEVLEVDGNLGQRNIEAASRAAAPEQLLQSRQR